MLRKSLENKIIVSFIIPVYNVEKYLSRCIESILSLKYSDIELVIINDGSKDNSGKLCDYYAINDCRVKVFHQQNKGVSFSRNLGIINSIGDYIVFVDSDDWIEPQFNEVLSKITAAYDVIQFGYKDVYDKKLQQEIIYNRPVLSEQDIHINEYFSTGYFGRSLWRYIFKRSIILNNEITFPENIDYAEDYYFVTKFLTNAQNVLVLPTFGYNYYHHSMSAMRRNITKKSVIDHIKSCILISESKYDANAKPFVCSRCLDLIKSSHERIACSDLDLFDCIALELIMLYRFLLNIKLLVLLGFCKSILYVLMGWLYFIYLKVKR